MKWESNGLDHRLVAEDGEILDRVRWVHGTSEYKVESTGKPYVTADAAKKAAERAHISASPQETQTGAAQPQGET